MPDYRRVFIPVETYFFTVVTYGRRPLFRAAGPRALLRTAIRDTQVCRPFRIDAFVLIPDHLHVIWTLPPDDTDFSTRWRRIKEGFTRAFLQSSGPETPVPKGAMAKGNRGVWQLRFWEHLIRDEIDLHRHLDYIHFNPVKHGLALCPHAWPYSSFRRLVEENV